MSNIRIPQLPGFVDGDAPAQDDLLIVYDSSTGVTRKATIAALSFTTGGGTGGVVTYTSGLWKVFNYSPGIEYDPAIGNTVISDIRLLGIDDGFVYSTQVASEFRAEQLVFDPDAGTLTLQNFELATDEHVTININGAANYAYNSALQGAIKTISDTASILAPFQPTVTGANGAKVMWMKPANAIPPGWQECVAMRGYLPMAQDPDDNDFKGSVGVATGGSKAKKLLMDNIPEHDHEQGSEGPNSEFEGGEFIGLRNWASYSSGFRVYKKQKTSKAGKADPDAINLLNPYRIVMWIEYIGLD